MKTLMARLMWLIALVADRKRCPGCGHDKAVHGRYGCLAAVYDEYGQHDHWCGCKHTYGKGERRA